MKYAWKGHSDDGCYDVKSEKTFDTQEECYADMVKVAVDKMKWNTEYSDVTSDCVVQEIDGIKVCDAPCHYVADFYSHKIVHTSYSGTYTYEIVTVADDNDGNDNGKEVA